MKASKIVAWAAGICVVVAILLIFNRNTTSINSQVAPPDSGIHIDNVPQKFKGIWLVPSTSLDSGLAGEPLRPKTEHYTSGNKSYEARFSSDAQGTFRVLFCPEGDLIVGDVLIECSSGTLPKLANEKIALPNLEPIDVYVSGNLDGLVSVTFQEIETEPYYRCPVLISRKQATESPERKGIWKYCILDRWYSVRVRFEQSGEKDAGKVHLTAKMERVLIDVNEAQECHSSIRHQ